MVQFDHGIVMRLETIDEALDAEHEKLETCSEYKSRSGLQVEPALTNSQIMELVLRDLPENKSVPILNEMSPITINSKECLLTGVLGGINFGSESAEYMSKARVGPGCNKQNSSFETDADEFATIIDDVNLSPDELAQKVQYQLGQSELSIKRLEEDLKIASAKNERSQTQIFELESEMERSQIENMKLEVAEERLQKLIEEIDEYKTKMDDMDKALQKESFLETEIVYLKYELAKFREKADYNHLNKKQMEQEIRMLKQYQEELERDTDDEESDAAAERTATNQKRNWRSFAIRSCPDMLRQPERQSPSEGLRSELIRQASKDLSESKWNFKWLRRLRNNKEDIKTPEIFWDEESMPSIRNEGVTTPTIHE